MRSQSFDLQAGAAVTNVFAVLKTTNSMETEEQRRIIMNLSGRIFHTDFSMEEEAEKIRQVEKITDLPLILKILNLVNKMKDSEKDFFIGSIIHPWSAKHSSYNFKVIEYSNRCFRLDEWRQFLKECFSDISDDCIELMIKRYVYFRHCR